MEDHGAPPKSKTVTGLSENAEAVLCYLGFWITGLIFWFWNKHNSYIRFHALQSTVVFGILFGFKALPVVGPILSQLIWLIIFGLWLVLIVKAHQGEAFEVPIVGRWVKGQSSLR